MISVYLFSDISKSLLYMYPLGSIHGIHAIRNVKLQKGCLSSQKYISRIRVEGINCIIVGVPCRPDEGSRKNYQLDKETEKCMGS